MPYATADYPDLIPYFKLDGTRTITGPSLLALTAGNAAFDAFTIRGAAGQTGKLLVLETSALADVFTVDVSGNLVITGGFTGAAISGTTINASGLMTAALGLNVTGNAAATGIISGASLSVTGAVGGATFNASGLATLGSLVSGAGTFSATVTVNSATNTSGLVVAGGSLTGANAQSLVSLTQTWNTSGSPVAILLNVTNTASNAASRLIDLKVAGSSVFSVDTLGDVRASRIYSSTFRDPANGNNWVNIASNALSIGNTSTLSVTFVSRVDATILLSALTTMRVSDASTNTVTNALTLGHNSTGTAAASFGTGLLFQGESSTTDNRDMGRVRTLWTTATDASRKARLVLSAFDTAERDGIAIEASGTAAMLGFFGAAPVIQQTVTGSKASGAALISLLAALVAEGLIVDSTTA